MEYAKSHLRELSTNPSDWTVEYICDDTGTRWILDYPFPDGHGGGPPRLRKTKTDFQNA
ncbi:MAG: hypothetical protein KF688_17950 [Pirellulales bacterium]|nr:hypothetical protein [Pirellulales bacterium]